MASSEPHHDQQDDADSEPELLAEDDALEEVDGDDGDVTMDSDDEAEELTLVNDSIAYFDAHKDSVFAIAQHPTVPTLIATGGSEGDADDAPGKGYLLDIAAVTAAAAEPGPVLPPSYAVDPEAALRAQSESAAPRELRPLFAIDGHTDSISALAFSLPDGRFLLSGGLDGRLRAYAVDTAARPRRFRLAAEAREVSEVNWLAPCPAPDHPHAVALGASDGSVWVYELDAASGALQIAQTYFLHTAPCTAGAWTPDGALLATVSEDGSLYVWDVVGCRRRPRPARRRQ